MKDGESTAKDRSVGEKNNGENTRDSSLFRREFLERYYANWFNYEIHQNNPILERFEQLIFHFVFNAYLHVLELPAFDQEQTYSKKELNRVIYDRWKQVMTSILGKFP